jgi:outer membrane protein TolC
MKRKTIIYYLILYCSIVFSGNLNAQKLTLERCREMALQKSMNMANAVQMSLIAKDNLKAYKTNYLPKFSASGNYLYSNSGTLFTIPGGYLPTYVPNMQTGALDPNILIIKPDGTPVFKEYAYMPDVNFDIKTGSVYTAGATVEQAIYMGGKVRSAVKMAEIGEKIALLNEEKTGKEVINKAEDAFFTYIKVNELLKSAIKYREVLAEFYRQMENAFKSGMKSKNDLMKVQVKLNEAEIQVHQAENGVRLARMNLCYNIGLPINTSRLEVAEDSESFAGVTDRSLDITSRPEYEMLVKQVAFKKLGVDMARSDFMPQLAASASYNYVNGVKINGNTLMDKGSFLGGVKLSVPLFHWGEGYRKISAARREVEVARNRLSDLSEQMQLELMQAINRYDEAVLEVTLTERSVTQAEENMRMSGNQYNAGVETLGDYLEAQALWQKSMSDLTNARACRRLAYSAYLTAAGK